MLLLLAMVAEAGLTAPAPDPGTDAGPAPGPAQVREFVIADFDAEVTTFAAEGRYLLLWLVPGYGGRDEHQVLATVLADAGMELWVVDLVETQFLPRGRNAQLRIDPELVAELIATAARTRGKPVVLMGVGGSAVPVLRGANAWLARGETRRDLVGAVLLSPSLLRGVPALGSKPEYLPIVSANRVPTAIFQPGSRPGAQRLGTLVEALSGDGTAVYAQRLAGVGSLFAKQARSEQARMTLAELPSRIRRLLPLLEQSKLGSPVPAQPAVAITERSGLDTALRPFAGQPLAPPIVLADTAGEPRRVDDYRDRVTVINFWASWCPPCVKEIPALNRLQQAMQDYPFRSISRLGIEDLALVCPFEGPRHRFVKIIDENVVNSRACFFHSPDGGREGPGKGAASAVRV